MTNEDFPMKEGIELLMSQGAIIALLPVEDLGRMDAVGPMLNPTLYSSGCEGMTKEILRAAIGYKRAILKAQADVTAGRVR